MREVQFGSPCPECGGSLGDEYGMISCPSCGANLFVTSSLSSVGAPAESNSAVEPIPAIDSVPPFDSMQALDLTPQADSRSGVDPMAPNPEAAEMPALDLNAADLGSVDPSDPLGVTAFDSAPESSGQMGPLIYDLSISGLDSPEQKEELMRVLSDDRLNWSISELRGRIKNGELNLSDVNPVKAAVIVQRLMATTLEVRWTSRLVTLTQMMWAWIVPLALSALRPLVALAALTAFSSIGWAQTAAGTAACKWSDHESKMLASQTKLKSLQDEIASLIAAKKQASSADQVKVITTQIQYKYEDLRKTIAQHEEERTHSRFAHPERALPAERNYPSQKLLSLDEIELAFGIDGRLDRLKNQIRVTYPAPSSHPEEGESSPALRAPAATSPEHNPALNDLTGLKLKK